jgi:menaquinone-dependent protoporphyrinogen oxidase
MRVLVTWGSKLGGTAGIASMIADELRTRGIDVVAVPADQAPSPAAFDAAIIGGALYANRWHRDARRYVERHAHALAKVPAWLFSSGPLDDSADQEALDAPRPVRALVERIGAIGHVTFGGRLEEHPDNAIAAAMAKKTHGDWRNPARIRGWADDIAAALPTARPRPAVEPHGRSPVRVVEYGVVGWALPAALLVILTAAAPLWLALTLHALAMPGWYVYLSARYQRATGARSPVAVAALWTSATAALYVVLLAHELQHYVWIPTSFAGFWLPLSLSFIAIWAAGAISAMLPMRLPPPPAAQPSR